MARSTQGLAWGLCSLTLSSATLLGTASGAVYYVAPTAVGDGSGVNSANAAAWNSPNFWNTTVQGTLQSAPVDVCFASGRFDASFDSTNQVNTTLQLSGFGNATNRLLIRGDAGGGTYIRRNANDSTSLDDANLPSLIYIAGQSSNIAVRNLNFTGPEIVGQGMAIRGGANNILVENCSWTNMPGLFLGAISALENTHDITLRNCTFDKIGYNVHAHAMYNSYDSYNINVVDNSFTDVSGDTVRFRNNIDNSGFYNGVITGNTFRTTGTYANLDPYDSRQIWIPALSTADPGNEYLGSHYIISNNIFQADIPPSTLPGSRRYAISFTGNGYNPPGYNYLLTTSTAATLAAGGQAAKDLLSTDMGLAMDQTHVFNNQYTNMKANGVYESYWSIPNSQSFEGVVDIANLFNSTPVNLPTFPTSPTDLTDASVVWSGNGANASWNTAGNWANGSVPTSTSSATELVFSGTTNIGSAQNPLNQDINTPFLLNQLRLVGITATPVYLGGNQLSFAANGNVTPTIVNVRTSEVNVANPIDINGGTTLTLNCGTGSSTTLGGVISGAGGNLVKTGSGTLTLTGNNTYSGGLTIQQGTLSVSVINPTGMAGPLGYVDEVTLGASAGLTGALEYTGDTAATSRNFTLVDGGTGSVSVTNAATTLTCAGQFTGGGNLSKQGSGTLTLTATNTYTGATTISAGVLSVGTLADDGTASNIGPGSLILDGGTLRYTGGTATLNRSFQLSYGKSGTIDVAQANTMLTLSNVVATNDSRTFGFIKDGAGTLKLNWDGPGGEAAGSLLLKSLTVNNGTFTTDSSDYVQIKAYAQSSDGPVLTMNGGTTLGVRFLLYSATDQTIKFSGESGTATISNSVYLYSADGPPPLVVNKTFDIDDGSADVDMSITGGLIVAHGIANLVKAGAGTLRLSHANTYTGTTTVRNGRIYVANNTTLGSTTSAVALGDADTATTDNLALLTDGNYTISRNIVVGAQNTSGTTTLGGSSSQTAGSVFSGTISLGKDIQLTSSTTSGNAVALQGIISGVGGVTKVGAGTATLSGTNGYAGRTTVKAGTLQLNAAAQSVVLTGGGADIQTGKLVFDYSTSADPATTIQSLLTTSYNGSAWNIGKFLDTTQGTTGLDLGWKDDAVGKQVTVMATWAGDANLDGAVNVTDLNIWKANVGLPAMKWATGDFNFDGAVNVTDLNLWKANVGKSAPLGDLVLGGFSVMTTVPVPEPGTLVLLLSAMVCCGYLAVPHRRRYGRLTLSPKNEAK
jgi:autotransporter-associated beta strand protein